MNEREQLRLPKKVPVQPGDVIEAVSLDGIIRITVHGNLEVSIDTERFPLDKIAERRALSALQEPLASFVTGRLTEIAAKGLSPQEISLHGELEADYQTEKLKRIFKSLLRQKVSPEKIDNEIKGLVFGRGGVPEYQLGPSPYLRNIYSELKNLLADVVKVREDERSKKTKLALTKNT